MREKQRNKTNLHLGVLTILLVLLSALLIPAKVLHAEGEGEEKGYLTFTSEKSFTITPNGKYTNLEYTTGDAPTNAATWNTAVKESTITAAMAADGQYYIYFRGTGNSVITDYKYPLYEDAAWKMTDTDNAGIACRGNIETLLDYQTVINGLHPQMGEECFYSIFRNCTCLKEAPDLPATTLSIGCYASMFSMCTNLTVAPALPATSMLEGCYYNMFYGCTGLTQAPDLPATTLGEHCYEEMFYGCKSLIEAPELPALNMLSSCYEKMFCCCTSLVVAPDLPATALDKKCYEEMFYGCTSLVEAPALPAMTLAESCYYKMFYECKSLTEAPSLEATTLAKKCYCFMFTLCENLKISETKTDDYSVEYIINGDKEYDDWNEFMFGYTGGTFTDNPKFGKTYYVPAYQAITPDKTALSFGEKHVGYTDFSSVISVKCRNNTSTKLRTSLKSEHFKVSGVVGKGDAIEYSISPKNGLPAGDYTGVFSVWINGKPLTKVEIPISYTVSEHVYDKEEDNACNLCGHVRDIRYPVAAGYAYYASYQGYAFYRNNNGDTRCYDIATGAEVYNTFICDGTYTYYFQYDRTAMRDRLTYHPDGKHIIYFDKDGHEVFSDYGHITTSIAGDKVDDYCFFDVYGYMYVDVMTYDITGTKIYYVNPYGVLEHTGWFMFSDGGYGYANPDMSLMTNQYTYDWNGNYVYMEANGHIRGTGDGRNLWPASSL